ncbi:MAG: hypothetical protein EAY65_06185 [Alphaproteobacteria bacterium]|nr:MAG: hypothetical protein EAY65_06185 [Alphaproteobacteria bacterium]
MNKIFSKASLMATLMTLTTLASAPVMAHSHDTHEDPGMNFSMGLVSDTFFGFAPYVNGSYDLDETKDLTVYGIFWSGGTGQGWGNWAEFGGGVNFDLGDGITLNPQLGFTSGNLLSSSANGPAEMGDGIVPNFTLNVNQEQLEAQVYAGYYAPLRDEGTTSSFLHYWASAGYKFNKLVSAGGHFEHLHGGQQGNRDDVYMWAGPYVQFTDSKGRGFFRVAGGVDLEDTLGNDTFYKMTFGLNF